MMTPVGSFNERGYLNGFTRRGFTPAKCLLELVANSLDSLDKRRSTGWSGESLVQFSILTTKEIRIRDNGLGMNTADLQVMFDLHRENHASDASRGVSGIGAKPALSILSGQRNMHMFTHTLGGPFLRADIPWEVIHKDGIFSKMITIREMTPEEAATFGGEVGTEICFPYNDALRNILRQNFEKVTDDTGLRDPLDRIGIVFGADRVRFVLNDYERGSSLLPMYNYFGADDADFYCGVTRERIAHWVSNTNPDEHRFIWNDTEIIQVGVGKFSKEPRSLTRNMSGYTMCGEYDVLVGLRRDDSIFDPCAPALPTADSVHRNDYNVEHLGDTTNPETERFLSLSKLQRNWQVIGYVPLADTKMGNSRSGGPAYLEIRLIQCNVRYYPVSMQNNPQDRIMDIQENKNRHDGTNLPLTFTRLVRAIRNKKANDIWGFWENAVIKAAVEKAAAAAAAVASEAEAVSLEVVDIEAPGLTVSNAPMDNSTPTTVSPVSFVTSSPSSPSSLMPDIVAPVPVAVPNGAALCSKLMQWLSPAKNYPAEIISDVDALIAKLAVI